MQRIARTTGKEQASAAGAGGLDMRGFHKDESGSLVVFALFLFVAMLLVAGMAVDLMRYETHRAQLQSTLDRAILAAANLEQTHDAADVVLDYFDRANLSAYIDASDITVEETLTSREVTAEARMDMSTTFMRLLGIDDLRAPAGGTAEESASRTEVSLVVDVSGSMAWGSSTGRSKISELRDAATQFVNILQCDPNDGNETVNCTVEPGTVSINLIPYSEYVQVGEPILSHMNVTNEHNRSTCIYFPEDSFTEVALDLDVEYQRVAHFDPWRGRWSTPYRWACRDHLEIQPLVADPADLRSAIADLDASSYTSIDMGVKWGAAMLDPAFRPVVEGLVADGEVDAAFQDRPYDYTETGVKKVLVVMTDGVNTTQNFLYDGFRDGPSGVWYNAATGEYSIYRPSWNKYFWVNHWRWASYPYGQKSWQRGDAVELTFQELWQRRTRAWYDYWWWLPSPGSSRGRDFKNARLDEICSAAKDRNITIFAIGFEVTSDSAKVMENCASSPAHFFDVEGADLTDAFAAIARQISALRLIN